MDLTPDGRSQQNDSPDDRTDSDLVQIVESSLGKVHPKAKQTITKCAKELHGNLISLEKTHKNMLKNKAVHQSYLDRKVPVTTAVQESVRNHSEFSTNQLYGLFRV